MSKADKHPDSLAITLPASEQLAVEVVQRLQNQSYLHSVMKLSPVIRNELARKLATPGTMQSECLEWLDSKQAGITKSSLSRFAQRFFETWKAIVGEHESRMLITRLAEIHPDRDQQFQDLAKQRVLHLVAQELVAAQGPGDIDTKRLFAIVTALKSFDDAEIKRAELQLKTSRLEQQAQKMAAEVDLLKQKIDSAAKKIALQIKKAQRKETGQKLEVSQDDIDAARRDFFGGAG